MKISKYLSIGLIAGALALGADAHAQSPNLEPKVRQVYSLMQKFEPKEEIHTISYQIDDITCVWMAYKERGVPLLICSASKGEFEKIITDEGANGLGSGVNFGKEYIDDLIIHREGESTYPIFFDELNDLEKDKIDMLYSTMLDFAIKYLPDKVKK